MNTVKKNNSLLLAMLSIALMIGSGFLLIWVTHVLPRTSVSSLVILLFVLLAVFIYVAGATLMGQSLRKFKVRQLDRINTSIRSNERGSFVFLYANDGIASGALIAFLFIAIGALQLCFNYGVLDSYLKSFFFSWPLLFFVIGSICIFKRHYITGLIVIAISIFIMPVDTFIQENFWPAVFIVSGIIIFISFIIRPKKCVSKHSNGYWKDDYKPNEAENNNGKINYRFIFGGTEQVILDPVFKGGTIEAIFSGMELDLRRTSLEEGTTDLYINTVFGGVDIKAPDTWYIEIKSKAVAGGVSDTRVKYMDIDRSKRLVIHAKCTFGGITIR